MVTGSVLFSVMLIVGILGAVGTLRQKNVLLTTYVVAVWLIFFGFWAVFAVFAQRKSRGCT